MRSRAQSISGATWLLLATLPVCAAAETDTAEQPLDLSLGNPNSAYTAAWSCIPARICRTAAVQPEDPAEFHTSDPASPFHAMDLGTMGPVNLRFTGNRIRMRLPF